MFTSQELIKVRGFQVAPAELEGHLLDHPDIADVCVVAAPDDFSGELPFAFVSLRDNVRAQVANIVKTDVIQHEWTKRDVQVHGWVYELETGRLRDLGITVGKNTVA